MGDIVNLRMMRKRAARRSKERQATVNRTIHGRSEADRQRDDAVRGKADKDLDQHRLETGDDR